MTPPRFTVVIPTRGRRPSLHGAVRAALRQQPECEILVIEDRRPGEPRSPHVLRVDPRARVLAASGPGPSAARNTGLDHAAGDYVAFLDDDDLWTDDHLEQLGRALDAHPEAAAAFTDARLDAVQAAGRDEATIRADVLPRFLGRTPQHVSFHQLLHRNVVMTSAVAVRRRRLQERGLRFDESLTHMEDYDLWLRLARVAPLVGVDAATAVIRLSPDGWSRGTRAMAEANARVLERHLGGPEGPGGLPDPEFAARLGRAWREVAHARLVEGDAEGAREAVRRMRRFLPLDPRGTIYWLVACLPERARWMVLRVAGRARGQPRVAAEPGGKAAS